MKNLTLLVSLFSVSLLAESPCDGLEVFASLMHLETNPQHACGPEFDGLKNRIVIRKPGYVGLNTIEEVGAHEINNRKLCGLGGHYYIDAEGKITQGRPETMKGANEINGKDGNTGKLGIQVLLPENQAELSEYFVGNFTKLLTCQMSKHVIWNKDVKTHFHQQFHPGKLVQDLLNKILANRDL